LPRNSLEEFEKVKYASAYPQGAVLFVEGQSARGVYIICSGRVKTSTTSRDGKTLILRMARPAKYWDCTPRFPENLTSWTAETLQPSQLDFVKRDDFLRFLQNHGDACLTRPST